MSMLTVGLRKISTDMACRKLERMEERDRLKKEMMTEEELAEYERREKEAHDEVWARIERGKALYKAMINGDDLDKFYEDCEHGTLTMSEEEIREKERLEAEDIEDDDDIEDEEDID